MTHWRGQKTAGGDHFPSALRTQHAGDLNFDERELGAITFALCCAASPFVVVGLVIFGYRLYVALVGLPA